MALTSTGWEAQALRRHLGYHNLAAPASPYTGDGFKSAVEDVALANLETAAETTATTNVTADTTTTVTVAAIAGISAYTRLVIDVGHDAEVVTVKSVSGSTFSAYFKKAHTQPFPVAIESGTAQLRLQLHSADKIYDELQSSKLTNKAGLKGVGRGAVEWWQGGHVLRDTLSQYKAVVHQLSHLTGIPAAPGWLDGGRTTTLEAY